ncbi:zincin [Acrodontium crateriforme]|uniref:Zincin n=1 Tax=Acrodontium crateriforme TaxID=150365 RepID=A0AAQ3LYG9_9PEZI|nr:zincin [Acrodontium crateriforme]
MAADRADTFVHQQPLLFDATALSITAEAQALIDGTTCVSSSILAHISPANANFENTILPLVEDENIRSVRENYLRFHASTSPSQDLRDASQRAATMLNDAETDFFSERRLFALVRSVMVKAKQGSIQLPDAESMHYLSKLHGRFIANGCGIDDDLRRNDFITKKKRVNDLARECRKNLADEKTGLWLTHNELEGVSESLLSRLVAGEGEQAGYLWLPTKAPFSTPALTDSAHESTRKKIYYAVMNRLPLNVALLREMTLLRDELARLLGWPNHLAFKTSQKMVGSPDMVQKLNSEIRLGLTPVAESLAQEFLHLKIKEAKSRGEPTEDLQIFFWDRYFFQKLRKGLASMSTHAPTSEYFELDNTLNKLFGMYEHLFGVRLVPVDIAANPALDKKLVWHDDVRMFSAWNIDGEKPEFLAYAYFDLFPRDGKYTNAGQYTLQRGYERSDGSRHLPCSCLVMNIIKPTTEKPTLLEFTMVRSLFHELGHMYHCILTRARYAGLHSVDTDFIEAPSMMLEQFFWDAQIIRDVSYHYSHISPAMRQVWLSTLPDAHDQDEIPVQFTLEQAKHIAECNASDDVPRALDLLFFSTYDILIHSPTSHEELVETNLCELFNKTRRDIYRIHGGEAQGEGWEFAQGQSTFRAIQGKYDAGYYAYTLGRLYGLNIFQAGFSSDLMNKTNARRYRDMVLCKGGSQPEMKTLTDYLGREPSTEIYLQWLGVGK